MRVNKHMTDALRLQIIDEYLAGASKYSLVRKYKLGSGASICKWLHIFGIEERSKGIPMCPKKPSTESEELRRLRLELKRVKKDLAFEQMRSAAFETMIDLTEKDLQISIRKKDITKP